MTNFFQSVTNVFEYLRLISLSDIIDIAILSFVFYKGFRMVRRGSTMTAIKAVGLVVFLLWISYIFNLNAINFILSKATELGMLAIIIIFQPEIRRFLEQIGSSSFANIFAHRSSVSISDIDRTITEVVSACSSLAKNHIGALIVFERKQRISDKIHSGSPFVSTVSASLLETIFFPKTALHDGALIMRDAKIVGAGYMLPLSSSKNLNSSLGSRHRAGVGITEVSDALSVIVSEETGTISVAMDGSVRRHLTSDTLAQILRNELIPKELAQTEDTSQNLMDRIQSFLNAKED